MKEISIDESIKQEDSLISLITRDIDNVIGLIDGCGPISTIDKKIIEFRSDMEKFRFVASDCKTMLDMISMINKNDVQIAKIEFNMVDDVLCELIKTFDLAKNKDGMLLHLEVLNKIERVSEEEGV